MPLAHVLTLGIIDEAQEFHNIIIVIQRFAAAHQHGAVDSFAAVLLDHIDLGEHFPRCQSSFHTIQSGGTEFTAHTAAHLCGNADRIAVFIFHQYTFDDGTIGKGKEVFSCSVDLGNQFSDDFHTVDGGCFGKFFS